MCGVVSLVVIANNKRIIARCLLFRFSQDEGKSQYHAQQPVKNNNSDITLGSHTLVHKVSKTKKSITKKYLLDQLNLYFKNQPDVAKDVSTQILNNREVVITEDIILK